MGRTRTPLLTVSDPSPTAPAFDADAGWISFPGFLSTDLVDEILRSCAELLRLPAEARRAGDKPAAGTRHLSELDDRSAPVRAVTTRSELTTIVAEILGPGAVLVQASYRSPQPSFGGQQLHADDQPKLEPTPDSVATAIVALTDFTSTNGATRLVPGSHRRPDLQRRSGSLASHEDEIVLTGDAGTAFVFSGHVLHSGTPNRSPVERPALQLVWRV